MTTPSRTAPDSPALTGLMELGQEAPAQAPAGQARPATRTPLVSVVIPALDEEPNIGRLLGELQAVLETIEGWRFEVIVVDDGSRDRTAEVAATFPGVRVHSHPTNLGNGASVKRGIRLARGDWILLMDGDGQHPPQDIPAMLAKVRDRGFDMVVGSRAGSGGALHRNLANRIYNGLASYVTGRRIPDLTSGFRLVRADALKGFVQMLPNTFSYPTTITLAMFKAGYAVHYHPIQVRKRGGRSKIRLLKDGSRFLMIIMKVATMFAPLRVFLPLAGTVFAVGLGWYVYTYFVDHRFTNMGVLLLVQSGLLFCLGLISEQIAQLRFDHTGPGRAGGEDGK
ncbi:MAG: glycosyltransferase family 2 protein [Planctomycetota bacterium]